MSRRSGPTPGPSASRAGFPPVPAVHIRVGGCCCSASPGLRCDRRRRRGRYRHSYGHAHLLGRARRRHRSWDRYVPEPAQLTAAFQNPPVWVALRPSWLSGVVHESAMAITGRRGKRRLGGRSQVELAPPGPVRQPPDSAARASRPPENAPVLRSGTSSGADSAIHLADALRHSGPGALVLDGPAPPLG